MSDVRCPMSDASLLRNGQRPFGACTLASALIRPKIKARNSLAMVNALLALTHHGFNFASVKNKELRRENFYMEEKAPKIVGDKTQVVKL